MQDSEKFSVPLDVFGEDRSAARRLAKALDEENRQGTIKSVSEISFANVASMTSETCAVILVGRISADSAGGLVLKCVKNGSQNAVIHLVVAPPPMSYLRNAVVWMKSWRIMRATPNRRSSSSPSFVCEVLSSDIVVLRAEDLSMLCSMQVFPVKSLCKSMKGPLHVCGYISCKSAVLSPRSKQPAFLLQLTSDRYCCDSSAVYVVFAGVSATQWWAFLTPGRFVFVSNLFVASLPKYAGREVLKAQGENVFVLDHLPSTIYKDPPCPISVEACRSVAPVTKYTTVKENPIRSGSQAKRSHFSEEVFRNQSNAFGKAKPGIIMSLISYKGEITRVMGSGRFELDQKVRMHLNWYGGWIAGPEETAVCLREGTRVCVFYAVLVRQNSGDFALLPTARSTVSIEYFGELPTKSPLPSPVSSSSWRSLWRHLSPMEVLWAEKMYTELERKFSSWIRYNCWTVSESSDCCQSFSFANSDSAMSSVFLGSQDQQGLILRVMELFNGCDMSNDVSCDAYAEFFILEDVEIPFEYQSHAYEQQGFPVIPTMREISNAVDVLVGDDLHERSSRCQCRTSKDRSANSLLLAFHAEEVRAVLNGSCVYEKAPEKECTCLPRGISPSGIDGSRTSRTLKQVELCERENAACTTNCHAEREAVSYFRRSQPQVIILLGVVEIASNCSQDLQIADSTGALPILISGKISPRFVGAVVMASFFEIIVFLKCRKRHRVFLTVKSSDLSIAVPSPDRALASQQNFVPRGSQLNTPSPPQSDRYNISPVPLVNSASGIDCRVEANGSSASPCSVRRFPTVALFVTMASVVSCASNKDCAQPSCSEIQFRVHGYIMAYQDNAQSSRWVYLKRENFGFEKCCLRIRGSQAMCLRPVMHTKTLYAISHADIPDGLINLQKSMCCTGNVSENEEWYSVNGDCHLTLDDRGTGHEVVVEDLETDGAFESFLEKFDHDAREMVATAVHRFREMRCEDCVDVQFVPSISMINSEHGFLYGRKFVSLKGTIVGITRLQPERYLRIGKNLACSVAFHVRLDSVPLVDIEVFISDCVVLPDYISSGIQISATYVSVVCVCSSKCWCLVLTESSSVHFCGFSDTFTGQSCVRCCNRAVNLQKLFPCSKEQLLSSVRDTLRVDRAPSFVGLMHSRCVINKIVWISLRSRTLTCGESVCDTCGQAELVLESEILLEVDDGTGQLLLLCHGFRLACEALGATKEESLLLKDHVIYCEEFAADLSDQRPEEMSLCNPVIGDRFQQIPLLARLITNARRPVMCFFRRNAHDRHLGRPEKLCAGIHLGAGVRGRDHFFTTFPFEQQSAIFHCLAVQEDNLWGMSDMGLDASSILGSSFHESTEEHD